MPEPELQELVAETRRACKGLINLARVTLQLATALEERLATTNPQPEEAQGHGKTTHRRGELTVAR